MDVLECVVYVTVHIDQIFVRMFSWIFLRENDEIQTK